MGAVRFYLERPKKGQKARITLYYSYKIDVLKFPTGERILPEHWDKRIQRPRRSLLANTTFDYQELSNELDDLENEVYRIHKQHKRQRNLFLLNKERFYALLKSFLDGVPTESKISLWQYIDKFISDREKSNYSANSIKQYRATKKHLITFRDKHLKYRFDFDDVGLELFKKFRNYFWESEKSYSDNTVHKNIQCFKLIVGQAYKEEYHNNDRFNIEPKRDLRITKHIADTIALSADEVLLLKELELEGTTEIARDLFLIGCSTGLRISDWSKVTKDRIIEYKGAQVIKVFTEKTRKTVFIPVMDMLRVVLEKYDYTLPTLSDQKINEHIKVAGKIAGFDKEETYRRIESGAFVEYKELRFNRISSHTGRRTFSTLMREFDIPASKAILLTGHATEKMFSSIYDKRSDLEEVIKIAENNFFKLT